jgi:PleD family two-component response regulator
MRDVCGGLFAYRYAILAQFKALLSIKCCEISERLVGAMPKRIMVVNDTQEILELFREILTDEGYDVVLYSYGIQDLAEVERSSPI